MPNYLLESFAVSVEYLLFSVISILVHVVSCCLQNRKGSELSVRSCTSVSPELPGGLNSNNFHDRCLNCDKPPFFVPRRHSRTAIRCVPIKPCHISQLQNKGPWQSCRHKVRRAPVQGSPWGPKVLSWDFRTKERKKVSES